MNEKAVVAVLLAGLAGCSNPLAPRPEDSAQLASTQRLREIRARAFDEYRRPAAEPAADPLKIRSRFDGVEAVALTLEEIRATTLANNLDLKVAVVDPTIARERATEEEARFESAFTLRSRYQELDSPTASQLSSAQSKSLSLVPGVRIPLRTGGTAEVSIPMSRNENNNTFSTLNPSYSSDVEFSISHQLLRGAGRRANTAAIRIAGYDTQAAEASTKLEVTRQLAAADRAYWRLDAARRGLEVTQKQYELAAEQEARAERRVKAGRASEIEVVRAQAGVAQRLDAIIQAENSVLTQQRELKRIVNRPGLEMESPTMLQTSTPPDPVEYEFDRAELIRQALDNRMELLELELRLAADAATIGFEKNQALPLFSLDYVYRINGLGGSPQDSWRTVERNRFEDWELGLSAEIPIGNEAARARVRQAVLRRVQRLATRQARESAIRQDVLDAADNISAAWQRIMAARQSVILQARVLAAEQRQFDVGTRTSTDVLDAAARLADAQLQEIRSLAEYQIAQIDLAFATGTLLGAGKVGFEPVPSPDDRAPAPAETLPGRLSTPAELPGN